MRSNPRMANGNARRKLREWLRSQGRDCAICGRPIDYALPAGDPMSFEVDEVVPVSRYWLRVFNPQQQRWSGPYDSPQSAAVARENVQAAHRSCNQAKGNRVGFRPDSEAEIFRSRDW